MKYIYNLRRDTFDERDRHFAHSISPVSSIKLPPTIDLRYKCPPIFDQGELGACTAHAGCACRAILLNKPQLLLSRLFLYYEERNMEGTVSEDSGASVRDICKAINKFGICEEQYMPYDINRFTQPPSYNAIQNAQKYKISAYKKLNTISEIKQSLAFRQQPVLAGMDIFESFESEEIARTGIMTIPSSTEQNLGGHCVLIVGYIDQNALFSSFRSFFTGKQEQKGYLIGRNSWGESWGQHGYFLMPYEFITQGHAYDFWIME